MRFGTFVNLLRKTGIAKPPTTRKQKATPTKSTESTPRSTRKSDRNKI